MSQMTHDGCFDDATDRYLLIYVETEIIQPKLFEYLFDKLNSLSKWNSSRTGCKEFYPKLHLLKRSFIVVAPTL